MVLRGGDVTQPIYESRVHWVTDPAPPASRPSTEVSPAPTPAILMPSSGASSQPPRCQKSRRRRRRKAARAANQNSASRQADLTTPAVRSANRNSACWRATQPRSAANDRPEMRSTLVEHPPASPHLSCHSFPSQRPANQNSGSASLQDHSDIWGLYKPAQTDPRQDLTATHSRLNTSGFGLSSPALQQPSTFSGLPSRPHLTSPYREAGEAERERPGIVYPQLPRAARPDTRLMIDAALSEAAALDRRSRPPTVLEITESRLKEDSQPPGPHWRQSRKRRHNRSTGVYRPSTRPLV